MTDYERLISMMNKILTDEDYQILVRRLGRVNKCEPSITVPHIDVNHANVDPLPEETKEESD